MDEYSTMKTSFNEQMYRIKSAKGKNTQLFTHNEYYIFLNKVKLTKEKTSHKTPEDYQRLSRYDIVTIGTVQRLIVPVKTETEPILYYCYLEETFDIIHSTHIAIGHGGRNKMMVELKQKYKNITKEFVLLYLSICGVCQKKKNVNALSNEKFSGHSLNNKTNNSKKEIEVKPIQSGELNSQCHVNLVDMQSKADNDFNFIMIYQDHLTKFVILKPLKSEQAEEVAYNLLDIFTIFGPPRILNSDNGEEFSNKIIKAMNQMWNEIQIVHNPNSETQDAVERANTENMLFKWMETHKTTKWSEGLRFIQFMKNRAYHCGIDRSPYEAMFGCKTQVGSNTVLPAFNGKSDIASEEEIDTEDGHSCE